MIEKLRSLCTILERMEGLYARSLILLEAEKNSLVKLDYETLYAEMREKDEILTLLRRLDKDRLRIQDQFAMVTGKPTSELTLKFLADLYIEEGATESERQVGQRLMHLRGRIQDQLDAVKHRIDLNGRFIEKSIQNLRGLAQALGLGISGGEEKASKGNVYTGKGRVKKNPQSTGSVMEKTL